MDLLTVDTVFEARAKLLDLARPLFTRQELVDTPLALGRVLAADLTAATNVPDFKRSTVDGYAVRAADTAGAGESIPTILSVKGAVEMGESAAAASGLVEGIAAGECAYVPTGGMLPEGSDAMVMIEHTEQFGSDALGEGQVGIYSPVAVGTNVVLPGDDVALGAVVCAAGTRVGAAEIGVAAALGITQLPVFVKPRITVISTGDEIVAPAADPQPGQVRDINSWALAAAAERAGYVVQGTQVVIDDEAALTSCVAQALQEADVVVISGGSSQGEKDATAKIIGLVASTGVLTHGLALKPGKPTITGFDEPSQTLLVGLPGHPLSALMVFEIVLGWLFCETQGVPHPLPVPAVLSQNLPGAAGKDTLQLVKLATGLPAGDATQVDVKTPISPAAQLDVTAPAGDATQLTATPVFTKSGLVSKLSEASGYIWIDRNTEGLAAGTPVAVHLLKAL